MRCREEHGLQVQEGSIEDSSARLMTDMKNDTGVEVVDIDLFDVNGTEDGHAIEAAVGVSPDVEKAADSILPENGSPSFFIDVHPSSLPSAPLYDPVAAAPLGTSIPQQSDEENIVFVPRTYRKPSPIFFSTPPLDSALVLNEVHNPPSQVPALSTSSLQAVSPTVRIEPRSRTRGDKKATKRDKRNRKKAPRQQRVFIEGSDIEWGSDGPPGKKIFGVEGVECEDEYVGQHDVEVLRDYLAGTLLNAKVEQEDKQEEEASDKDSDINVEIENELRGDAGGGPVSSNFNDSDESEKDADDEKVNGVSEREEEEGDWESSSGSGASSDLGELKVALEDAGNESKDIEKAEVEMFAATDTCDEADWFIRSMEVDN